MTDRELLELAAKAAGYKLKWGEKLIVGDDEVDCTDMPYVVSGQPDEAYWYWDPLTDDGDALRLAVKLGLLFKPEFAHFLSLERFAGQDRDDYSAYRRAIVRAAAAIGEAA